MSNPLFPSSSNFNSVTAVNPTLFSIGRPVGGAENNVLLGTDAVGILTSVNSQGLTSYGIQPLDTTLTALSGLNSTPGLLVQTGTDTFTKRELTGTSNQIFVINGTGQNANPQIGLDTNITIQGDFRLPNIPINSVLFENASGITSGFASFGYNGQAAVLGQDSINNFARLTLVGIDTTSTNFALRVFPSSGSAIFTVRNDGQTTNLGSMTASSLSGNNVYALSVTHLGGSVGRNGLLINSSGTSATSTVFRVQTGAGNTAMVIDGAGNIGINREPISNMRLTIASASQSSLTQALRIQDSATNDIAQFRGDRSILLSGPVSLGVSQTTYAMQITNTGVTTTRPGLYVSTSGTGSDTTVFRVDQGTNPIIVVTGDQRIGFGTVSMSNSRVRIQGLGTNNTTNAFIVRNGFGTVLFTLQDGGGFGFGNTSADATTGWSLGTSPNVKALPMSPSSSEIKDFVLTLANALADHGIIRRL